MKHFTNTLPLILLAAPALAMTPATGQAQTSERGLLEEVIVTAQKREQNIQDVPVSVTALSADSIVANRIHDVSDLGNVVPNLTIRPSPGGNMIPQYSLRGIFTYGTALGTDKGVSVYIDGVYMQNASGSTFEMADIDQIEVLRGPQGTLFGRNSTGGAINIRTRKPSGEFNIHQELTTGNYAQFRSKTRLDLPRKGPLSMSISYLHSEREGDIRNLGAGTAWDHGPASGGAKGVLTSPKRLGDKNINSVFVAADLDLHDNFDLSYKFDLANTNFTPDATGVVYMPSMSVLGLGVTPEEIPRLLAASSLYASSPSELTPVTNKRPKAVNNWWSTNGDSKVYGHNLTANWRLNDWATLKNILAYRKMTVYVNFQLDGMGGLYAPGTGDTVPLLLVATNGGSTEKQWSDELQLNITRDQFSLTAGLIHFQNDQEVAGIPGEFNTLAGAAIVGQGTPLVGTPFVVPANTGYFLPNVKSKSDAFYIQPEIHLTDQVDFVLGYRVTRDDKKGRDVVPGSVQPYSPSMGNYTLVRYKDTRDTYMVGLNYKPVDNVLTYAKYATGFISGGQLATIVFAPEKAKSFEVGVKSELFERRLRSNLSVFHVDYDSIQQVVLGARAGIPAAVPYGQAVIPAADATAYGFEWENTYVPLEGCKRLVPAPSLGR